ncbi:MAG: pyridoxal phosphate-dependent aminotransferase [Candidatus Magasanikbacteria bacterium]|nr:pyridoxal phosphate-dependent aminotransferase [Candidatus Magasanikbacteria bacterium]
MNQNPHNAKSSLLIYGIREVVDLANKLTDLDPTLDLVWENIGDPVDKGWPVPPFLKEILKQEIDRADNRGFAYTHSRGNIATRKWAAEYCRSFCPAATLGYEDILFTNGLGSGIALLYQMIAPGGRVLEPCPTYPTHASFESFCSGQPPIFYNLNPNLNWEPDLDNIEANLVARRDIVGITIINPNNPTGTVYSRSILEKIVEIAEKYKIMIIADEIYWRMIYPGATHYSLAELAHNRVPLIVMRGLSKDVPWPGSRSGWLEFHNTDLDSNFKAYAESIKKRALLEVCASTLPQIVAPLIYNHPGFAAWNKKYTEELALVAGDITKYLQQIPELEVNAAQAAFYMMPYFKEGALNNKQTLPIKNLAVKKYIEELVNQPSCALDKRFACYLLAHTGIVLVPASDFFSPYPGFRITTLERDGIKRKKTYETLIKATRDYLKSA